MRAGKVLFSVAFFCCLFSAGFLYSCCLFSVHFLFNMSLLFHIYLLLLLLLLQVRTTRFTQGRTMRWGIAWSFLPCPDSAGVAAEHKVYYSIARYEQPLLIC